MMVTQTSPWMKPFITGVEMKLATHPIRSSPKIRKKTPTITASAAVSASKGGEPLLATTAPMVTPEISAVAESGPMIMVREVPKIA